MDTSLLLAQLIGPLFVTVGIGILMNPIHYGKMVERFLGDPQLYYFSGAMALLAGLAIIIHHNLWVADWRAIITVIGWMSLIKGIARIVFPTAGPRLATNLVGSQFSLKLGATIVLLLGLFLTYQGFVA